MRRRLPASASDASREALNSSKQREAPPLPPDLLNLRQDYRCDMHAVEDAATDRTVLATAMRHVANSATTSATRASPAPTKPRLCAPTAWIPAAPMTPAAEMPKTEPAGLRPNNTAAIDG